MREWLFYRAYRRRAGKYASLFERAELALAPGILMQLSPTDVGHQPIALGGVGEAKLSRRLVGLARRGGLLVDVGANYGYFTCLWAAARPGNRVVAFEASAGNAAALRQNVESNGLAERVTIHERAVGRKPGVLGFRRGPEDQTGQGGAAGAGDRIDFEVPVCTLDDVFDGGESIAVLKIDVEGADTWVLEGAARLLREGRVAHIFFELFPERMAALGVAPTTAPALLQESGYRVEPFKGDEWYATAAR